MVLAAIAVTGCTSGDATVPAEAEVPPLHAPGHTTPPAPREPSPTPPADTGPVPKLMVRGFGVSFDKLAPNARSFERYAELLAAEGFPAEHVHDLGNYDDGKTMTEMSSEVAQMISKAMAKYPETTRFDVFGHSLGGILALRAVLDHDLHRRVRTFVALSAPIRGQDSQPLNCTLGLKCTDVYEIYRPFDNERVKAYMTAHGAELDGMRLCSEISPDDGVIENPMEGAQFAGARARNVVVDDVSHLAIIKSDVAVKALVRECFDGAL